MDEASAQSAFLTPLFPGLRFFSINFFVYAVGAPATSSLDSAVEASTAYAQGDDHQSDDPDPQAEALRHWALRLTVWQLVADRFFFPEGLAAVAVEERRAPGHIVRLVALL